MRERQRRERPRPHSGRMPVRRPVRATTRERDPARWARSGSAAQTGGNTAARRTDWRPAPTQAPTGRHNNPLARRGSRCNGHRHGAARVAGARYQTAHRAFIGGGEHPASACRPGSRPAPSPGRRADCAGSFTILPRRYRTQSRRRLLSILLTAEAQRRTGGADEEKTSGVAESTQVELDPPPVGHTRPCPAELPGISNGGAVAPPLRSDLTLVYLRVSSACLRLCGSALGRSVVA
jgi:hypothetical protein